MGFFRRRTSSNQAPDAASSATGPTSSPPPAPTAAPDSGSSASTQETDQEQDQQLPGVAIHYQTWGAPNAGRAAVLIHGLTANHMTWALLGPHLANAGYYVIAPDLRGRGLSGKPPQGYGVAFHAADLLGLLDALNIRQADIVGHSLGAVIAMYLGAVHPTRVRKLALIDAGGKIPEDTAQAIGASVARLGASYPSLDAYLGLMRQLPMITEWTPLWDDYFRYDAETRPDGTVASRVPKSAIEEESLALALTRSEALPDLIHKPTLLIRATVGLLGPDRGFILPRDEAERVRDIIAGCQLVEIGDTNHYTVVTVPAFADAVSAFLGPAA
jgi:pimeloyl-ACP methyl ester carboxylesterase